TLSSIWWRSWTLIRRPTIDFHAGARLRTPAPQLCARQARHHLAADLGARSAAQRARLQAHQAVAVDGDVDEKLHLAGGSLGELRQEVAGERPAAVLALDEVDGDVRLAIARGGDQPLA